MEVKSGDDEQRNQNRILLEETFYVLTKKNCVFRVRLTRNGLCLIKETENNVKEQLIPIGDIIGCRCLRSKKQSKGCSCQSMPARSSGIKVVEENSGDLDDTDVSAYLYIYAYILQNNKRERTIITLRFRSFDKYEDNNKEAQRWRTTIKKLIKGEIVTNNQIVDFSVTNKHKEERKLLVLCNPKSGAGKGRVVFQQKVAPLLQEAEIPYDLHITKHANYAREFVRNANMFQWTGVIMIGGDGIVFEVLNGIFERWDWSEVVRTVPLGVIPSGSGNGLARSITYMYSEPYFPAPQIPLTLAAIRHNCVPMDLVRVETTSQIMFSFLSVGWGFMSDVDIESERLRMLGNQRFTVWCIARIMGLRSYRGKLYYLPTDAPDEPSSKTAGGGGDSSNVSSNLDLPSEVYLETQGSRQRIDSWYSAASKRSAYFSATGSSYQSTADSGAPGQTDQNAPRMYGPASQLPCLTALVPPTWKCMEGRFVLVHACYTTHLGEDILFAPESKLNDGIIWLLIVKAGVSRSQLLSLLLGLSAGSHAKQAENDGGLIQFIPVKAFRIEPDMSEKGYVTVDGEHVEYGPIQAEIFPELGRIMVP